MIRSPWLWSLVIVFASGRGLFAQEDPPGVRHETLENALRELGAKPARTKESYRFVIGEREFKLNRLDNGARILLQSSSKKKASLEALNRYNERQAVTTRAVRYGNDSIVLETGLDCLGVNEAGLRRFVTSFAKEMQGFEDFLAKQRDTAPGTADIPDAPPPVVGKQPLPPKITVKPALLPLITVPGSDDKELEIVFPTAAEGEAERETSWKIVWDVENGEQANKQGFKFSKGRSGSLLLFKIKKAYFKPGPKAEWLQVLEDAHASEFYVPYYFQNTRFFDLRDVGNYVPLNAREGGPRSRLLGKQKLVMAELRDRGLAFKHGDMSRRGEELTLWANFQAGNYTYLVEFGFQDDGTIALRHAPTGYNYFDHFDSGAHMHNCLWRIGVKLALEGGGTMNNKVQLVKLPPGAKQQGPMGKLEIQDVKSECGLDWEAKEFTRVRVVNPDVSVFPLEGKRERLPIAYDLAPLMQGQARHDRNKDEGFSAHDFWVTRPDSPEKMYVNLHKQINDKTPPRPLNGPDGVVLWHMSSALHLPRAEDGIIGGNSLGNGQALVNWTIVELRPRNLFTKTPIYRRDK